jgi:hypothetical protein
MGGRIGVSRPGLGSTFCSRTARPHRGRGQLSDAAAPARKRADRHFLRDHPRLAERRMTARGPARPPSSGPRTADAARRRRGGTRSTSLPRPGDAGHGRHHAGTLADQGGPALHMPLLVESAMVAGRRGATRGRRVPAQTGTRARSAPPKRRRLLRAGSADRGRRPPALGHRRREPDFSAPAHPAREDNAINARWRCASSSGSATPPTWSPRRGAVRQLSTHYGAVLMDWRFR